jgi:chromosome segregation ATPase
MVRSGEYFDSAITSGQDPADAACETIALLQEEIARLENELRDREDACQELESVCRQAQTPEVFDPAAAEEASRLRAELSARDETIGLLLDQLRLVEEAEAASRAEWEQLAEWVAEVEERVDRQDRCATDAADPGADSSLRHLEELRAAHEQERQSSRRERARLEEQIARLEAALAESAASDGGAAEHAAAALESENRRLREALQRLEEARKAEAGSLAERLEMASRELDEARRQVVAIEDQRQRERREFDLAVASLRSHASRAAIAASDDTVAPARPAEVAEELDADMRIRAFRLHLKEIHTHEAESRNRQRLGARLSRLWGRTTPS